ncbi:hypothetical protein [Salinibacter ruber]|uniref:hypothetical protein n=1 Tax=Salinibacter ruber TaxID=146919 RepID=UPI002168C100|nr:hypothetical protein [Salinibacter ruber]
MCDIKLKTSPFRPTLFSLRHLTPSHLTPSHLILSHLALLFLLCGCGSGLSPPEENAQVLFVALDGTGSYDHLRQAKRGAVQALEKAPPGSKVYVRWITGNSAAPEAAVGSAYIPPGAENPYDTGGESRSAKKKLARSIAQATSPESKTTDLQGLIWAASKRFEKHPKLSRKLLLATDLRGNSGRDFPEADLTGASVRVVGFEVDPSRPRREGKWKKAFREAGADTTTVRYLDRPGRNSAQP